MATFMNLSNSDEAVNDHSITLIYLPDHSVELFPQGSATTFTVFNKLPPELRNMVWKLSCLRPRCIKLRIQYCWCGDDDEDPTESLWVPPCHPQVTLRVNRESRDQALKYFTILINPTLSNTSTVCQKYKREYINPNVDTLIFPLMWIFSGKWVVNCLNPQLWSCIRSLELNNLQWRDFEIQVVQNYPRGPYHSLFSNTLCWTLFTGLEYLFVNISTPPNFNGQEHFHRGTESLLSQKQLEDCARYVVGNFEYHKARSPEYNIPRVEVRQIRHNEGQYKRGDILIK